MKQNSKYILRYLPVECKKKIIILRITAMLCCTGDSVPSFGLYSKNWSMLISSKPGIISDLKTYYLLYKIHIDCSEQSKFLLAFNLFSI